MDLFVSKLEDAPVNHLSEGARTRRMWGEPGGPRALLVEIDAGHAWPELDVHEPGAELVYVVSGDYTDAEQTYGPGTFLRYAAGTSHQPRSAGGCRLLVFYPEG